MLLGKKRAGDRKTWLEEKGNLAEVGSFYPGIIHPWMIRVTQKTPYLARNEPSVVHWARKTKV